MTVSRRRGSPAREVRRAELLDAADRVISSVGPQASMRAIAAAAGITKPILYRYFGDKGGLYSALADRYLEPLIATVREALTTTRKPDDRVRATVDAYLRFIAEQPQVYRFLMQRALVEQPEAHSAVSAAIRRLGLEIAAALRETTDLGPDADVTSEALGHAVVGMVYVTGDWWLEAQPLSREQLADHLTRMLSGGLNGVSVQAPAPSGV